MTGGALRSLRLTSSYHRQQQRQNEEKTPETAHSGTKHQIRRARALSCSLVALAEGAVRRARPAPTSHQQSGNQYRTMRTPWVPFCADLLLNDLCADRQIQQKRSGGSGAFLREEISGRRQEEDGRCLGAIGRDRKDVRDAGGGKTATQTHARAPTRRFVSRLLAFLPTCEGGGVPRPFSFRRGSERNEAEPNAFCGQ
ncbi:hypothetical protein FI667_g4364, partial [Globisporangium splendens]